LKLSGEKAWKNYSNQEAITFYKDAITKLKQLPDTEENKGAQIDIYLLMLHPMKPLGYPGSPLEILEDGERLSKELRDEKSLAKIYASAGVYYTIKGDPLKGIRYTEDAFNKARKMQDIDLMAPLARGLFLSYADTGERYKVVEAAPDVIRLLEETNKKSEYFGQPLNLYSYYCSLYGLSLAFLGDFKEGKIFLDKGHSFAIEINDLLTIALSELHYGVYYLVKGDGKQAIEHC